jgi:hypothetical protein
VIRDWGLWELTDEDWHGVVPIHDPQKQQQNLAKRPQHKEKSLTPESLAPESLVPDIRATIEAKANHSFSSREEGELESTITPQDKPTLQEEDFADNETVEKHSDLQPDIPSSSSQQEQDLEPIRVTSPKVSQSSKTTINSKPFVPLPSSTVPSSVESPQETGFETVEIQEEAIAPPNPAKVSLSHQKQDTETPSQSDSFKVSGSQTALQVGDWQVTVEEIVPLLEKYQLLPKLVREMIIDRALVSTDCPKEELTKAIEGFYQQQKVNSPQQLQVWLQQKQTTAEQVQNAIARGIKLEKFKEQMWGDRLDSYFLERKPQLDKVLYSLLRTQDMGIAQELYFRILEEEAEFSKIAKEYSQGVEAKTGGIVGPISLSKIHPTLKEMFQRSKPGQLWSPQCIDNWFVVVRLEQFVPAKLDEEIRQQLLDEQFNQWLQEQYQQVIIQRETSNK